MDNEPKHSKNNPGVFEGKKKVDLYSKWGGYTFFELEIYAIRDAAYIIG